MRGNITQKFSRYGAEQNRPTFVIGSTVPRIFTLTPKRPRNQYYFEVQRDYGDPSYQKKYAAFLKRYFIRPGQGIRGLIGPGNLEITDDGKARFIFEKDFARACLEEDAAKSGLTVLGGNTRKSSQQIIESLPPSA